MKTAIIIPTYNNEEYTLRCIESIHNNTKEYVILWVDDGSSQESIKTVKHFLATESIPHELIAKKENSGFAKSVNLGLERALELDCQYIVIQNNDTEVFAGWLLRMIHIIECDSQIGAVGPITSPSMSWQSVDKLQENIPEFADLPTYSGNPEEYARSVADVYEQEHVLLHKRLAFFSVVLNGAVVREIGYLSEEYGVGFGEDDDYMLRMRQKGYRGAVAKGVFVFHNHNTTFKSCYTDREINEMREENRDVLFRKFKKGRYRPQDLNQLWDIEEAIAYAQQLELLCEKRDYQVKEKIEQEKEKNKQLRDKNEQLAVNNILLKKLNGTVKKKVDQLHDIEMAYKQIQTSEKKARLELKNVYGSTSWRITAVFRRVVDLLKKGDA